MDENNDSPRQDKDLVSTRQALERIVRSLEVDGYKLTVDSLLGDVLAATITATAGACEECLVPKSTMEGILLQALPNEMHVQTVQLSYSVDISRQAH